MQKEKIILKSPISWDYFHILFTVLLGLKLTGNIDWSWWWVTMPIWFPLSVYFFYAVFIFVFLIIKWKKTRNKLKGIPE